MKHSTTITTVLFIMIQFLLLKPAMAQTTIHTLPVEGYYKIKVVQTGKYLAIEGISEANDARLVQWNYVNQGNHQFYIRKNTDDTYYLYAKHSKKHIVLAKPSKADGTAVVQDSFGDQLGRWSFSYSAQAGCQAGWKMINAFSGTPVALNGQGDGAGFELRTPHQQDGDTDCTYTFEFERLDDPELFKTGAEKISTKNRVPVQKKDNKN
jgi:hypothetical protein